MWKPNLCSACFSTHKKEDLEVKHVSQEGSDATKLFDWEFKQRLHVDPLRKLVLEFPYVENVMFKSTLNSRDVCYKP
jgi:hypothetical protein